MRDVLEFLTERELRDLVVHLSDDSTTLFHALEQVKGTLPAVHLLQAALRTR